MFSEEDQDDIYSGYVNNEFERTNFPFKGEMTSGIIYPGFDAFYMVPVSTILANHYELSNETDDDFDEIEEDVKNENPIY